MARDKTIDRGIFLNSTGWTGKALPWTAGNQALHEEIDREQVTRWTPKQIQAAQKRGYFDDLSQRCLKNIRLGLMDEIMDDEE